MANKKWFANGFKILITFLVFAFYIGGVFFAYRQSWEFLLTFGYWFDTVSSTTLAFVFRWLYSDTGVSHELEMNEKIKAKEELKSGLIGEVTSKDLVGELKELIDKKNRTNKLQAYKDKIDRKLVYYRERGKLYPFKKRKYNKWSKKKKQVYEEDFNLNNIKVKYYRYDLDEMLSSFYKEQYNEITTRINKDQFVLSSLRTNVFTILVLMIYNATVLLPKDFSWESVSLLIGKLIIFTLNIYNGYKLGKKYISVLYSDVLSKDFEFLKTFIKEYGKENINDIV